MSSLSGVKVGACQLTDFYFSSMRSLGPQGYWGRSSKTQTKSSAQGLTLHIKGPLNNRNLCLGNRVELQVSKDYSSTCSTDCIFFFIWIPCVWFIFISVWKYRIQVKIQNYILMPLLKEEAGSVSVFTIVLFWLWNVIFAFILWVRCCSRICACLPVGVCTMYSLLCDGIPWLLTLHWQQTEATWS